MTASVKFKMRFSFLVILASVSSLKCTEASDFGAVAQTDACISRSFNPKTNECEAALLPVADRTLHGLQHSQSVILAIMMIDRPLLF